MTTSTSPLIQRLQRASRNGTITLETAALLVGALFFVLGFLISIIVFWGRELDITGAGSIGIYAAIGGAVVAILAVLLGRYVVTHRIGMKTRADGLKMHDDRLRWYDILATNEKLHARSVRTVVELSGAGIDDSTTALRAADGSVKLAVLMLVTGADAQRAKGALVQADGILREAIVALS